MSALSAIIGWVNRRQSLHMPPPAMDPPGHHSAARMAADAPGALARPPFVLVHQLCGKPAFFLRRRPEPHTLVRSKDIMLLDGSPAEYGSEMLCGSCGERVTKLTSADVVANV